MEMFSAFALAAPVSKARANVIEAKNCFFMIEKSPKRIKVAFLHPAWVLRQSVFP
jgi:hypothetical protein